jgi:hypothetical protein
MNRIKQHVALATVACGLLAAAGCAGATVTKTVTSTSTAAAPSSPAEAAGAPSPSPSASAPPTLRTGRTVTVHYTDSANNASVTRWTLSKAENLGTDTSNTGYDVIALYLTIANVGTTPADGDPLTDFVWVGANGRVDDTIGGIAGLNNAVTAENGTDLSLQGQLAPGQSEVGYVNVDVPRGEQGVLAVPDGGVSLIGGSGPNVLLIDYS